MSEKNTASPSDAQQSDRLTAPEVPREIAKQYGVHAEQLHKSNPKATDNTTADTRPFPNDTESQDNSLDDDPETDAAVDEIVKQEGDQLLDMGQEVPTLSKNSVKKRGFVFRFFRGWWRNRFLRYATILLILGGIVTTAVMPHTRYTVLNTVGVRSGASIIIVDESTKLPLKNVQVIIAGQTAKTDIKGIARVQGLKLGKAQVKVSRLAFAPYERTVTVGWGSNPLGTVALRSTGLHYTLAVSDYVTGMPIESAEAASDQVNALSDDKGMIDLTVTGSEPVKLSLLVSAPGYRAQQITIEAVATAPTPVSLVPVQKTAFVSKASGKYDVYISDLDGQNKKILLAGTGHETSTISLVVSPDNTQAVLVSTRDNKRDAAGTLLQGLTFIDLVTGASSTVDYAMQIQLVDWFGGRLIYRSTVTEASADPQRNRLVAYTYASNARTQLASANQFNTLISAKGYVYYAPAATDQNATLGMFRVKPDGSNRERLSDEEVWSAFYTTPDVVHVQTAKGWSALDLDSKGIQPAAAPDTMLNYYFATNPSGTQTAWAATRGGAASLFVRDSKSGQRALVVQPGLAYPVRWVNDTTIIYRVAYSGEIADYVVSTKGGVAHKISDVAPVFAFIQAN